MRSLATALVLSACLMSCSREARRPPADPRAQYLNSLTMQGTLFSTNNKQVLITGPTSGVSAAMVFDMASRSASAVFPPDPEVRLLSFFPEDDRILYSSRPKGETSEHLFVRNTDATTVDVTPWSGVRSVFYSWSHDKKSFYIGCNKDNRRFLYLCRIGLPNWAYSTVLQTQDMKFAAISGTGTVLALWKYISPSSSEIFTYDLEGKTLEKIAPRQGPATAMPQVFDQTKPELYYLTDEGVGKHQVMVYDLPEKKYALREDAESLVYVRKSPSGRYLVLGFEQDAKPWVKVVDMNGGKPVEVLKRPFVVLDFSRDERLMLISEDPALKPESLRIYSFETGQTLKLL